MYALNKEIERRTVVRAAAAHGALSHVMHVMCQLGALAQSLSVSLAPTRPLGWRGRTRLVLSNVE